MNSTFHLFTRSLRSTPVQVAFKVPLMLGFQLHVAFTFGNVIGVTVTFQGIGRLIGLVQDEMADL